MDLKPLAILDEIKKRPPLQRKVAENGYRGIKISWKLYYKSAYRSYINKDFIHVSTTSEKESFPWIYFEVQKNKYPELNNLHEGEEVWVDGKIKEIDGHTITLDIFKLSFSQPITSPKSHTFVNSQVHLGRGDINHGISIRNSVISGNKGGGILINGRDITKKKLV